MKIESKLDIFAGVFLVVISLWLFSDKSHILTRGQLLAPVFLGIYFIFEGTFGFVHHRAKISSKKNQKH